MLRVSDLYGKDYDLPFTQAPAKTYMAASVPRSGSTYFVLRLWAKGVFGAPLEYLNDGTNHGAHSRWGAKGMDDYWRTLRSHRTSANGVFGYKMFTGTYRKLLCEQPSFLSNIAPDYVLYFTRADKIAQAISYARAVQTGRWFAFAEERSSPTYCFDTIRKQEVSIYEQEAAWEKIFTLGEANPLRIEYSEFLSFEDEEMRKIAAHMGVELDNATASKVGILDKQSDALNSEWHERYMEEKAARGIE